MTVSEGSVKKYIEPSRHVIEEYKVSTYIRQQFSVLEDGAENVFGKRAKQLSLAKFNAG